jgi:nicotinate-nucleotide adenylyltransferase
VAADSLRVGGGTEPTRPWGVLGGTFDPPHYAHLAVAEWARESLDLAGVLFVPVGIPPHKGDRIVTAPSHRVAMLELAISGNPAFRVCRLEVDRPGPSYSADTIEALRSRPPHAEVEPVFILSAEAARLLHTWHDPARLLRLCRVAVVPRPGFRNPSRAWLSEHFPGLVDRFTFLDGPDMGHSASEIRHRIAAHQSIRYLLPPAVETYLVEHRLYPPELWTKN